MNVRRSTLVGAAVLAGAVGIGLVVLGWWAQGWHYHDGWERYGDVHWWIGGLVRGFGMLMLGKMGFKIALAGVVATLAAFAWYRNGKTPPPEAETAHPTDEHAGTERPPTTDDGARSR